LLYAISALGWLSPYSIAFTLWLSLSVNYAIDALGHSNAGNPTRTRLTHSVFTAPLFGALVASVSTYVYLQALAFRLQFLVLGLWTAAGVLIALGHLFLDSLTQAGVYRWRGRIAIAHFKYDNPILNIGFTLAGLGLIILAILHACETSQMPPIPLSFVENFPSMV